MVQSSIIITTKDEIKQAKRAIRAVQNQNLKDSEIVVVTPNHELNVPNVRFILDEGVGKYKALKQGTEAANGDICIYSDGDIILSDLSYLIEAFKDKKVGVAGGRVIPIGDIDNKYCFWAHWLSDCAHLLRKNLTKKGKFVNLSGYLFAIRKDLWNDLEKDRAEDTALPLYIYQKGYNLVYEPKSIAYVKSPHNLKDFIDQKTRTAAAHFAIKESPKSFTNEAFLGIKRVTREKYWLFQLFMLRFYIWIVAKFRKKDFRKWETPKSTK